MSMIDETFNEINNSTFLKERQYQQRIILKLILDKCNSYPLKVFKWEIFDLNLD